MDAPQAPRGSTPIMTGKTHFRPPNRLLCVAAVVIIAILLAAAGALSTSRTIDAWHAVGVARDVVRSQGLAGQDWYPHGGRLARGEALLSRAGCSPARPSCWPWSPTA